MLIFIHPAELFTTLNFIHPAEAFTTLNFIHPAEVFTTLNFIHPAEIFTALNFIHPAELFSTLNFIQPAEIFFSWNYTTFNIILYHYYWQQKKFGKNIPGRSQIQKKKKSLFFQFLLNMKSPVGLRGRIVVPEEERLTSVHIVVKKYSEMKKSGRACWRVSLLYRRKIWCTGTERNWNGKWRRINGRRTYRDRTGTCSCKTPENIFFLNEDRCIILKKYA